jgi:hypothetical protein
MSDIFNGLPGTYAVFTNYGVLIKESSDKENSYKIPIIGAYRFLDRTGDDDPLCVAFVGIGPTQQFPVDSDQTEVDPNTGIITFSVYDGNYTIRRLIEEDGVWLSPDKTPKPVKELEAFITGEGPN